MKKEKINKNTFIGGWYIPEKICDDLIKFHKDNFHLMEKGETNYGVSKGRKDSFDIRMEMSFDITHVYLKALQEVLEKYIKEYKFIDNIHKFTVVEKPLIQFYKKGGGYHEWHCERANPFTKDRVLVFMTYLNDLPDGGTDFYYQGFTTKAKKGLTLIWPSDWTHTHKSQVTKKNEKYIITGWYSFCSSSFTQKDIADGGVAF
tara:strand:- start:1095 stop:1703 length:609 start_codon:yes stop_codon:yes gene_type:complete